MRFTNPDGGGAAIGARVEGFCGALFGGGQCTTPITPKGDTTVQVANTGAFQRLIDDGRFVAEAAKRGWTPEEALGKLKLEDLPPCYTAVLVRYQNGAPVAKVQNWHQAETDAAGSFVDPSDCRCAKLGSRCDAGAPCPEN